MTMKIALGLALVLDENRVSGFSSESTECDHRILKARTTMRRTKSIFLSATVYLLSLRLSQPFVNVPVALNRRPSKQPHPTVLVDQTTANEAEGMGVSRSLFRHGSLYARRRRFSSSPILLFRGTAATDSSAKMASNGITTSIVSIDKPEDINVIVGMTHFIKTVDDIHEALVGTVPGIQFGLGFCEASMDRLVRWTGTDEKLIELAKKNAQAIGCGHSFVLFLGPPTFPIHILNTLKMVPEVCRIFCATANTVDVIVAETASGRGIMGVVDGQTPLGVETEQDIMARRTLLKDFGYKL